MDDRVIILGGYQNGTRLGVVREFNLSTKKWSVLFSIKDKKFQGRYGHSASLTDQGILIYGGWEDEIMGDLILYDLEANMFRRIFAQDV